jgi:hypothetical protein
LSFVFVNGRRRLAAGRSRSCVERRVSQLGSPRMTMLVARRAGWSPRTLRRGPRHRAMSSRAHPGLRACLLNRCRPNMQASGVTAGRPPTRELLAGAASSTALCAGRPTCGHVAVAFMRSSAFGRDTRCAFAPVDGARTHRTRSTSASFSDVGESATPDAFQDRGRRTRPLVMITAGWARASRSMVGSDS